MQSTGKTVLVGVGPPVTAAQDETVPAKADAESSTTDKRAAKGADFGTKFVIIRFEASSEMALQLEVSNVRVLDARVVDGRLC